MTTIRFKRGDYIHRGQPQPMEGRVMQMTKPFSMGTRGGFVTVDGSSQPGWPERNIRIFVDSQNDYEVIGGAVPAVSANDANAMAFQETEPVPEATDDEIIARLRQRFSELTEMTKAVKRGDVRGMIVSGPPGVGKSHGIEEVLERYDTMAALGHQAPKYEFVKGATSALGLYCKLFEFSGPDNVLVFDDCDSILFDEVGLNLLKAALDSKKSRRISWNTDSNKLRNEGIPNSFEFEGSVIFVTNIKFDSVRSPRLRDHLMALESRCHYIDLTIDTIREKMLRIRQVVGDGMLDEYHLSDATKTEIVQFVDDNKNRLREVSLRTILKTADLAKAFPNNWQNMASATVMKLR
jgi:hypothetical protein